MPRTGLPVFIPKCLLGIASLLVALPATATSTVDFTAGSIPDFHVPHDNKPPFVIQVPIDIGSAPFLGASLLVDGSTRTLEGFPGERYGLTFELRNGSGASVWGDGLTLATGDFPPVPPTVLPSPMFDIPGLPFSDGTWSRSVQFLDNEGISSTELMSIADIRLRVMVPEPSTALLLASGLVAMAVGRRRRAL